MKHVQLGRMIILGMAIVWVLMIVSAGFAAGPTGASPLDPLRVPTSEQTIAPNTTLWFYFDYTPDTPAPGFGGRAGASTRAKVNVTVDAHGAPGLQFAIYTPTQASDWLRDPTTAPVGRGTPYVDALTEEVTHDLYWSGAFNIAGRYFVALTNPSANAISFRLTVTGDTVTLYPTPTPSPSPTLFVPITVTPVPTGTIQGKIVFETATGGDIYTVNGDGSNLTRVSHGIDPAWSPDGKQIVFARWDNVAPGIYIANADGSNEQLVFGTPRARWPQWSPDGRFIVFAQDKSKDERTIIWKLGVVELATGKLTEPQCTQLCFVPSWGPDSTTIAFTDPGVGIQATSRIGGAASLVLGPTGMYWDASKNAAMPILYMPPIQNSEWSSDGRRIVYSQKAHDRWEVNVVNADGSHQVAVTKPDLILTLFFNVVHHNVAPTWSPDNQQILFLSDRNGTWEFFVTDLTGATIRQVLKNVTDQVAVKFTFENERMMDWTK